MSGKTLKFDNIEVDQKEFHASKQAIDLNLVDINKIVASEKFKHSDKGFKYLIGCKDDNIVRPFCTILPQMSGYIKYFVNGGKNMSFMIEDDSVLVKYNEIWNKIKHTLNIKFHRMLVYDEKYIKAKVPKEGVNHTRIAYISYENGKKELSTSLFRIMKI